MNLRSQIRFLQNEVQRLKADLDLRNASAFLSSDVVCRNLRILETLLTSSAFDNIEPVISGLVHVKSSGVSGVSTAASSPESSTQSPSTVHHQTLSSADATSSNHVQLFNDPPYNNQLSNNCNFSLGSVFSTTGNISPQHNQSFTDYSCSNQPSLESFMNLSHLGQQSLGDIASSSMKSSFNECLTSEKEISPLDSRIVLRPSSTIKTETSLFEIDRDAPRLNSNLTSPVPATTSVSSNTIKSPNASRKSNTPFIPLPHLSSPKDAKKPVESNLETIVPVSSNVTLRNILLSMEGQHPSTICFDTFESSCSMLPYSSRIDSFVKPFQCGLCLKGFTQASKLRIHKRVHSGEKPYHCTVCHKSFTDVSNLIRHKRIHSGEKPYQCDVCHKSFTQSSHLSSHKRVHSS